MREEIYKNSLEKIAETWDINKKVYMKEVNGGGFHEEQHPQWLNGQEETLMQNKRKLDEPGVLDALIASEARTMVFNWANRKRTSSYDYAENEYVYGSGRIASKLCGRIDEIVKNLNGTKINRDSSDNPHYDHFLEGNAEIVNTAEFDILVENLYKELGGKEELFVQADQLKSLKDAVQNSDGVERLEAEKKLSLGEYASGYYCMDLSGIGHPPISTPNEISEYYDEQIKEAKMERNNIRTR